MTARGQQLTQERIAALETSNAQADGAANIASLQRDLHCWRTRQVTAELAPGPSSEKVKFGTEVCFTLSGRTKPLKVVDDDGGAPAAGLISFDAPLSRAMLGAQVGDLLAFGNAEDAIEIQSLQVPGE